ncbi:hypothetical protein ACFQMA_02470 [Halosimplex aquaticum]|uniref:Uncharacterized protein n=1 Tax=Halosimplex aquaticum TaxID=3026162 RepID=A0ABD5Y055_9EURY|nr:hypothetical protein [Halosimplex aquaticum]
MKRTLTAVGPALLVPAAWAVVLAAVVGLATRDALLSPSPR